MTEVPSEFQRILDTWKPVPETVCGDLVPWPAQALAALLGSPVPEPGSILLPLWSEVYLREPRAVAALGPDGHPHSDALVPPLVHRRRMFGGGRITVTTPLRIGERASRRSSVKDMRVRQGRSGWLLLLTELHEYHVDERLRVFEERDVVYRLPGDVAGQPRPSSPAEIDGAEKVYQLDPDERLLFCFSALTYNAHRIHYDRRYAVDVEGHPDLLVHGPLLVLGAIEAAVRTTREEPASVSYRLVHPSYPSAPVRYSVVPSDEQGTTTIHGVQSGVPTVEASVTWR